jgi:FHS family glucose/mannose:H+ symporter-like MFS transporter
MSVAALYSAFALTGIGIALLGATLPAMLARWSLTDRRGGFLLLCVFLASSLGAVLTRGSMTRSVARGAALLVPACAGLAFASGRAVFPLFFLYGLGLGITMTSISRLRSQRRANARVSELNRLNLTWSLGAFSCPWLANEILRLTSVACLFLMLAGAFAAFTAWVLAFEVRDSSATGAQTLLWRGGGPRLPLVVAFTTLLATGLESSTGAWIATYAQRLRSGFEAPVAAASVFWFGMLSSRALYSTRLVGHFTERVLLRTSAAVATLGCIFLLASRSQGTLLIAGFLIGFGVGPIYPLLLAAVLPRISGNTIFVVAGLGGTTFPWLTGLVSTQVGSLHVGMFVPAMAGFLILACAPGASAAIGAIEEAASP